MREQVLSPIKGRLVGKDEIVEVLGIALTAGENAFLLGPPGTGKSALVHEMAASLRGRSFDYLLTRFTEPSELFGPFDLRRLRDGDLVTNTDGMLPEADFVFLDELLNANSAILNSLLLALNERVFRRGKETVPLPMLMAVGASNRLPEDDALAALYDRFLLRIHCDNVEHSRLGEVLDAGWRREQTTAIQPVMSIDEVRVLQHAVNHVDLSTIAEAYAGLILRLREAGMSVSDRRAVRLQRVVAASAVICGRSQGEISDLWVLRYIWDTPAQIEPIASHVDAIVNQAVDVDAQSDGDSPAAPSASLFSHPMADRQQTPDPEHLLTLLDAVAQDPAAPTAPTVLVTLAARVEWVTSEESRQALKQRIEEVRALLPAANRA
ncbi:MAG TPA: ATPase [Planctomycetaceae bacterium]|nr:ATPase [Planctomycetaceae bacterium]